MTTDDAFERFQRIHAVRDVRRPVVETFTDEGARIAELMDALELAEIDRNILGAEIAELKSKLKSAHLTIESLRASASGRDDARRLKNGKLADEEEAGRQMGRNSRGLVRDLLLQNGFDPTSAEVAACREWRLAQTGLGRDWPGMMDCAVWLRRYREGARDPIADPPHNERDFVLRMTTDLLPTPEEITSLQTWRGSRRRLTERWPTQMQTRVRLRTRRHLLGISPQDENLRVQMEALLSQGSITAAEACELNIWREDNRDGGRGRGAYPATERVAAILDFMRAGRGPVEVDSPVEDDEWPDLNDPPMVDTAISAGTMEAVMRLSAVDNIAAMHLMNVSKRAIISAGFDLTPDDFNYLNRWRSANRARDRTYPSVRETMIHYLDWVAVRVGP